VVTIGEREKAKRLRAVEMRGTIKRYRENGLHLLANAWFLFAVRLDVAQDSELCLLFRHYLRRLPTEFHRQVMTAHRLSTRKVR